MYTFIETGRIRSQPKGELWFRVKDVKCQHSSPCRGYYDPPWGEPTVSWKSFLFACTMQASLVLIYSLLFSNIAEKSEYVSRTTWPF